MRNIKSLNWKNKYTKLILAIVMLLVYLFQFIIIPGIFPYYYNVSNEATALYLLTITVAVIICCLITTKLIDWIVGDFLYLFFIFFYTSNGAYGIKLSEYSHLSNILIESLYILLILTTWQYLIILFFRFVCKIRSYIRRRF